MMEAARWLVAIVAIFNFGGLLVDGLLPATARTHLYNPHWPPHAKFHNCQTMLLGVSLGTIALVLLFAVKPLTDHPPLRWTRVMAYAAAASCSLLTGVM